MSRKQNKRKGKKQRGAKTTAPTQSRFTMRHLLLAVLAAELLWAGWIVGSRLVQTAPPSLPIEAELMNIQDKFRDQVEPLHEQLDTSVRSEQTPQAWLDLGSLYLTTGHYPQAELCLRHAQSLDADSPDIAYALATALDLMGRMNEAIEQYELASKKSTGRQLNACHYQIGKNYLRLEEPENAIATFREVYTVLPASYELVKIYTRQEKLDQAIREMRMLIHNRPRALETHSMAARIAEAQGMADVAAQQRRLADKAERQVPFAPLQEFSEDFRERITEQRYVSEPSLR